MQCARAHGKAIVDITVDNQSQIEVLAAAPWGNDVDLTNNFVEVNLEELVTGASRVGISTHITGF